MINWTCYNCGSYEVFESMFVRINRLACIIDDEIAALICIKGLIVRSLAFYTAIAIVGSSTYYHFAALGEFLLLSN
jgi:hypothetical protein